MISSLHEMSKETDKRWKLFPNNELLAKYDFLTQLIMLSSLDTQTLDAAHQGDYASKQSFLKLLAHEYRHWIDHISTLWGQRHLIHIYNSYNAWLSGEETNFHHIAKMKDYLSEDFFPQYYSTYEKNYSMDFSLNWVAKFTCGIKFDKNGYPDETRPIFFMNISSEDGVWICRVPFSVASLLETSAIAEEWFITHELLSELEPDARVVELKRMIIEAKKIFYDPKLSVYSVAAHHVANHLRGEHLNVHLAVSRAVATLCLNLADHYFDRIMVPSKFVGNTLWGARTEALLKQRDRGFAFVAIVSNGPRVFNGIDEWLNEALIHSNLPNWRTLESQLDNELYILRSSILSGPKLGILKDTLSLGHILARRRGVFGIRYPISQSFLDGFSAPIILGDDKIFVNKSSKVRDNFLSPSTVESWFYEIFDLETRLDEFAKACSLTN